MSDNYTGRPTFKAKVDSGEIAMSALLTTKKNEQHDDDDYPDGEPIIDGGKSGIGNPAIIGISVADVIVVLAAVVIGVA